MRCAPALLVVPALLVGLSCGVVAQERPYTEGDLLST